MPFLPATEEIITIRPFGPFRAGSEPSSGPKAWVAMIGPDEVDVHLAAEFVGGEFEHRTRDRNAGIVDETGERFAVEGGADLARGGQHRGLIGDVEDQRREVRAELALEAVGVGLLAHAAEHAETAVEQQFRAGPADAGGRAGDDNRSHDPSPCEGLMKFVVKECLSAGFVSLLRGCGQP